MEFRGGCGSARCGVAFLNYMTKFVNYPNTISYSMGTICKYATDDIQDLPIRFVSEIFLESGRYSPFQIFLSTLVCICSLARKSGLLR